MITLTAVGDLMLAGKVTDKASLIGNFVSSYSDEEDRRESYQKTALSYFTDHPPALDNLRTVESFILHCKLSFKGIEDYKLIPIRSNEEFQPVLMDKQTSEIFLKRVEEISQKFSHLDDPVWDEMDDLWEQCKRYNLKSEPFGSIIKRLHHIRFRHLRLAFPYLRAKFRG